MQGDSAPFDFAPKPAGSDIRDRAMNRHNPCYKVVPMRALHSLVELMNLTGQALAAVNVATLVIHARHDHTVPHACADRIVAQIGRDRVTSLSLARSFHLVSLDVERDDVAADFFAARIGRGNDHCTGLEAAAPDGAAHR